VEESVGSCPQTWPNGRPQERVRYEREAQRTISISLVVAALTFAYVAAGPAEAAAAAARALRRLPSGGLQSKQTPPAILLEFLNCPHEEHIMCTSVGRAAGWLPKSPTPSPGWPAPAERGATDDAGVPPLTTPEGAPIRVADKAAAAEWGAPR
jgi:hypothetical protein